MDKYQIGPKNRIGLVIVGLFLLGAIFSQPLFSLYKGIEKDKKSGTSTSSQEYTVQGTLEIPDYITFGDNNQYVASSHSIPTLQTGELHNSIGRDYLVTIEERTSTYNSAYVAEGEYYKVAYQRIEGSSDKKIENLSEWMKKNKKNKGIYDVHSVVHANNTDYLIFIIDDIKDIVTENFVDKNWEVLVLDFNTGRIQSVPDGIEIENINDNQPSYSNKFVNSLENPVTSTTLYQNILSLNYSSGSRVNSLTDKKNSPSTNINLFVEYNDLKHLTNENNQEIYLYPREGLVTPEMWFNDLLHWFAPVGQESLTVHTQFGNNSQADTIAIRSYADYEQAIAIATSEGHINPSDTAE